MDLLDRLIEHRTLGSVPREELQWLVDHGELRIYEAGSIIAAKDAGRPEGMFVVLSGRLSMTVDRGAGPKKVMEWHPGDVTGLLPYSRIVAPPGNSIAEETSELLVIREAEIVSMARECHQITSILVHVMVDRARQFNTSDMHDEKLVSLGKLSAGLAHELNNPASAVARSAKQLTDGLVAADVAGRALGRARLSDEQIALLDATRDRCLLAPLSQIRSSIEEADREEEFADWLAAHGADESTVDALAESAITIEALDELASRLDPQTLDLSLRWIATGCSVRRLAIDIEQGANRIFELVSAVKGFTYMDQARMPQPTDVGEGLRNTLAVMNSKARSKSVAVSLGLPDDLPMILGLGGELNQVWANLIDNAVDAVGDDGHVDIDVRREGASVVVRITDDGPGIPEEIRGRIFDPFFTTKPIGQGTGLGLDISRRLIQLNNGDITLESVPGRTTFTVSLPVAEPIAAAV
jgi:signal transduction histidine kinase